MTANADVHFSDWDFSQLTITGGEAGDVESGDATVSSLGPSKCTVPFKVISIPDRYLGEAIKRS